MTRRERLERKIERRREWAESRQQKADQGFKLPEYARDWAFITQPGHIPARARINRQVDKACENQKMAEYHESKADGLERQLETTIFSDDPDAIEALQAKIADLEAKQERMKTANALVRKKDIAGLVAMFGEKTASKLMSPDYAGRLGFPSYALTNNNANIRRLRARIADIQYRQKIVQSAEQAGGVLIKEHGPDLVSVTFAEKPERQILDALRAANFWWGSGCWTGKREALPDCVRAAEKEAAQ